MALSFLIISFLTNLFFYTSSYSYSNSLYFYSFTFSFYFISVTGWFSCFSENLENRFFKFWKNFIFPRIFQLKKIVIIKIGPPYHSSIYLHVYFCIFKRKGVFCAFSYTHWSIFQKNLVRL